MNLREFFSKNRFFYKGGRMAQLSWGNLSIKYKLFVSLGFSSFIFVISTILIIGLLNNIKTDIQLDTEKGQEALTVSDVGALINAKDSCIADYITFLKNGDVVKYRQIRIELNTKLLNLQKSVHNKKYLEMISQINQNNNNMDTIFFNEVVMPSVVRLDTSVYTDARNKISTTRDNNTKILTKLTNQILLEKESAFKTAQYQINLLILEIILVGVFSTILSVAFVFLISNSLKKNLSKVITSAKKAATGDLNIDQISYTGSDEIGELSIAVNGMFNSLKDMVHGIQSASRNIYDNSDQLRNFCINAKSSSEGIAETMLLLSSGAEEQASSTAQLFSHYDLLNNKINLSTEKGTILKNKSENVLNVTLDGERLMSDTVHQIETVYNMIQNTFNDVVHMGKKMNDISRLADVIKSIASQTQLLALNASIEAARAGDLGAGFSVVAKEVRKLANGVEDSLSEINDIVSSLQEMSRGITESLQDGFDELKSGTKKIQTTGSNFHVIKKEIEQITDNVIDISTYLENISSGSQEVKSSFEAIAATSQQFTAGTVESSDSIHHQDMELEKILSSVQKMTEEAAVLADLAQNFKL